MTLGQIITHMMFNIYGDIGGGAVREPPTEDNEGPSMKIEYFIGKECLTIRRLKPAARER